MTDRPAADALVEAARAWLAEDPDRDTRAELAALLDAADGGDSAAVTEIADRFGAHLQFGTAGLRAALGAGPNRMNRVVVMRAAAGLASHLEATGGRSIVIGYDARHKSDVFARDTAAVAAGCGLRALLLSRPLPTPVLAFAVRHFSAAAGVMVTASHNPAPDNGYKIYLGDGAQIAPPVDAEIAACIRDAGPIGSIAHDDNWTLLDDSVLDAYISAVSSMPLLRARPEREIRVTYTPLHGVGGDVLARAFSRAGFPAPHVVSAQATPDPDFPTVAFPNPEEPGAIELAVAAARASSADMVLANDPDADRCAVAVPTDSGDWRMLSGDEVGVLLADFLLHNGISGRYVTTIASSSLLSAMAAAHSVAYSETLTGFKWIVNAADDLVYGYEEALGYCVAPEITRDKDGISAALIIALLAANLKAAGSSMLRRLDEIAREYGTFATDQLSMRVADISQVSAAVARLRRYPPTILGGLPVVSVEDLACGVGDLPPADALRYRLHGSVGGKGAARVVVRPSGTEPKLKCYLEVIMPAAGALASARALARELLDAIRIDLVNALGPGLS